MKNISLNTFTNQYKLSKTIRNELIPIGKTAQWIKTRDIISHDNNELKGKDAVRALNYKYAKKLFDAMHRLFIEDCLNSISQEKQNELKEIILKISIEESLDNYRKEISKLFKFIYDEQANRWIFEYKYEMPEFWQQEINELREKFNNTNDKKHQKYVLNIIKKLQKKIENPKVDKAGISALYNNTSAFQLLEWKILSNKIEISGLDLGINDSIEPLPANALIKIIRSFDGFHSYFSGFNENRANVYDLSIENNKYKSTAIIHRIFEENLFFFVGNIKNWHLLQKSLVKFEKNFKGVNYDYKKRLKKVESDLKFNHNEVFVIDNFVNILSQSGIDKFNQIIGGKPAESGKNKIQGINEWINLARAQVDAKRNQFPPLKKLHKQILSKGQAWFIEDFKDDTEMLTAIKDFHHQYFVQENEEKLTFKQKTYQELKEVVNGALAETGKIFIKKDKLHSISQLLTGSWHSITDWIINTSAEKQLKSIKKQSAFSILELEDYFNREIDGQNFYQTHVKDDNNEQSLLIFFTQQFNEKFIQIDKTWHILKQSGVLNLKQLDKKRYKPEQQGYQQVAEIKEFLDSCNELNYFVKDWTLKTNKEKYEDWYNFINSILDEFSIYFLYNKVRNYIAKKPFSTDKVKINFDKSTLLDGWDKNKEVQNLGVLFTKDNQYYLGIMTTDNNTLFDYDVTDADSEKKAAVKSEIQQKCIATATDDYYQKINYKLLPGPNKMLPKVFFAKSNLAFYQPSAEIIKIKQNKLYSKAAIEQHGIDNLHKYIGFCIESLAKHPEWSIAYGFSKQSFKPATSYQSIDEFYKDVEDMGYKITFDNIKTSYIDKKVENGELYLFKIHNKDFSKYSTGTKNLHTLYWQAVFAKENLIDVVIKLNGEAEIFYRPSSLKLSETTVHEKGQEIKNKNIIKGKETSQFAYDIIKDKRYTQDKFFFHCPITLNAKAGANPGKFNDKVNKFLQNNKNVNIIGIDRGEKHLLYYSVINQSGNVIEQKTFNKINNVDYLEKLKEKEISRDEARKSWTIIENVKELKAGYLSHVIHNLAQLIIKHNAIVVLEDLNIGFKRGRFKVERQVYQKFEKALIDKLNYLVFKKDSKNRPPGHYLNGYQLTNKFTSFQKLGKQSGILFYTTAAYTSITDPITGFIKNIYKNYSSVKDARDFWSKFESIIYNKNKDRFEFTYDTKKLNTKNINADKKEYLELQTTWTVCSNVVRSQYNKDAKSHELFEVNSKLKDIFAKFGIDYKNTNLQQAMIQNDKKDFHKSCIYYFNAVLNLRVTDSKHPSGSPKNDFILSPVEPFFDSRNQYKKLPENGDANGAYNIARKGICILQKINQWDVESRLDLLVTKKDWQSYCQNDEVVHNQIKKM